jgi:transposase
MYELLLLPKELAELRSAHREARKKRDADRIKAVVLLASGWSIAQVAQALLLDEDTVRNYLARYRRGGLSALLKERYQGGHPRLNARQQAELEEHLQGRVYGSVKEIIASVRQRYQVS